jgi:hypothetical protein
MTAVLLGSQEPTHLWHPPYHDTLGPQCVDLYNKAAGKVLGRRLDPYQEQACHITLALPPDGHPAQDAEGWLCYEMLMELSRQNGKGEWLVALELFWLFVLNDPLIAHSAHLYETAIEHFYKLDRICREYPPFVKRIAHIYRGHGQEEIILKCRCGRAPHTTGCDGNQPRLKVMSRKGGAGRGFTGNKTVYDECMYLDAVAMAAGVPAMATRGDSQIIYAGSAGMKHSTQMAAVRKRGMRGDDDSLGMMAWEIERPIYDENGRLVGGDDPTDPRTHAKVNPAYGPPGKGRISALTVEREAKAMGGYESLTFWTERLGVGDWPEDDDRWEVIAKDVWKAATDHDSMIGPVKPRSHFLALAGQGGVTTLAVAGKRLDGKTHFEVIARHRGTAWVLDKLFGDDEHPIFGRLDLWARLGKPRIAALKNDETTEVALKIAERVKDRLIKPDDRKVIFPTEGEYAAGCAALVEGLRTKTLVHIGQQSTENAVAAAMKRENPEGGWRWSRDVPIEQAPIVASTLAVWLAEKFGKKVPKSAVW